MSYYIMSHDGQLIERLDSCPSTSDLREIAEECECDLYVIEGEHSGITYDYHTHVVILLEKPKPRLVFGQPVPEDYLHPQLPGM
jgi:hypothetical protein